MKLFYLPLESYIERYTYFMSSVGGWAEDHFKRNRIDFERIDGETLTGEINVGVVLDVFGRNYYAMSQIQKMILKIRSGEVKDGDVIYLEDFWHAGIEALFQIRELTGIDFKIGTFIHAQSIDDTDFMWPMRYWARDIERGFSKGYDYVFTCSHILKKLAEDAGFEHIYKSGLPYNSTRLLEQLREQGFDTEVDQNKKEKFVLFSSRFDKEKNPHFFMDLVEANPDIQFKLVKPRKKISNDDGVIKRLEEVVAKCPNLEVVDTSNKHTYYDLLKRAKVQFNCAYQDWVSWTLLEAITFKCNPLYPNFKDFPYELAGLEEKHIYWQNDLKVASRKLHELLEEPFNPELNTIVERHNNSWKEYLGAMNLL